MKCEKNGKNYPQTKCYHAPKCGPTVYLHETDGSAEQIQVVKDCLGQATEKNCRLHNVDFKPKGSSDSFLRCSWDPKARGGKGECRSIVANYANQVEEKRAYLKI